MDEHLGLSQTGDSWLFFSVGVVVLGDCCFHGWAIRHYIPCSPHYCLQHRPFGFHGAFGHIHRIKCSHWGYDGRRRGLNGQEAHQVVLGSGFCAQLPVCYSHICCVGCHHSGVHVRPRSYQQGAQHQDLFCPVYYLRRFPWSAARHHQSAESAVQNGVGCGSVDLGDRSSCCLQRLVQLRVRFDRFVEMHAWRLLSLEPHPFAFLHHK
mmetsp:Transcript_14956/g.29357  ORF Transcript_14956/g.29357 Transcript_14956/m.29357 type:complete len:208 (+) Transcript_14956:750-1373(+)